MRKVVGLVCALLVGTTSVGATITSALADEAETAQTFRKVRVHVDVDLDGTAHSTFHFELFVPTIAAAQQAAQFPLTYSAALADIRVIEAYTLKPDGQHLDVDASAIHEQLVPGSADVPLFNDHRRKVVVFPAASAGDVLVLTTQRDTKSQFSGEYTWSAVLDDQSGWDDYEAVVTAPATLKLWSEQHDLSLDVQRGPEQDSFR